MISAQRVNKLLAYLCKHMPAKEVEGMKSDIETILGFDVKRACTQRRLKKEREFMTNAMACARIVDA